MTTTNTGELMREEYPLGKAPRERPSAELVETTVTNAAPPPQAPSPGFVSEKSRAAGVSGHQRLNG
jgi:hypothetical protein